MQRRATAVVPLIDGCAHVEQVMNHVEAGVGCCKVERRTGPVVLRDEIGICKDDLGQLFGI